MRKLYFGFGIAPSMFPDCCTIEKNVVKPSDASFFIDEARDGGFLVVCLNPSDKAMIEAMRRRFRIVVRIPASAPAVTLKERDELLVMGVTGLPRLEGRHEYTKEEVAGATFIFHYFKVQPQYSIY